MGDLPFLAEGDLGAVGEGTGDAAQVAGFRWSIEAECERFVVDFATAGGAPAAELGTTNVGFLADRGLVRAVLPGLEFTTVVADSLVESPLVGRAFVVRLADGTTSVDLHLVRRSEIRVLAVDSPARLVFDVRPLAGPPIDPPVTDSSVVLLQPRAGDVSYPLLISGYVAPGVRSVSATLPPFGETAPQAGVDIDGEGVLWSEFTLTMPTGPPGLVDLTVATSAGDAVTVPVRQR